jgi:hypothetical protein
MNNDSNKNTGVGKPNDKGGKNMEPKKKKGGHYWRTLGSLVGFSLIGSGIGYFGNIVGLWTGFTVFFSGWWTLLLIIPCLAGVLDRGPGSLFIFGLAGGVIALILQQGPLLLVPVALIYIGLRMIFHNKPFGFRRILDAEDGKSYFIPVWRSFALKRNIKTDENFHGAEVIAWFSPINLDLSDAVIDDDAVIYVKAMFAPVTIKINRDINLLTKKTGGVGKLFVEAKNYADIQNMPVLRINAGCIFNSVTIIN